MRISLAMRFKCNKIGQIAPRSPATNGDSQGGGTPLIQMQTQSHNSQEQAKGDDRVGFRGRQKAACMFVKANGAIEKNEDRDVQAKATTRKFEEISPATYQIIRCLRTTSRTFDIDGSSCLSLRIVLLVIGLFGLIFFLRCRITFRPF